jgi:hypothetical protein
MIVATSAFECSNQRGAREGQRERETSSWGPSRVGRDQLMYGRPARGVRGVLETPARVWGETSSMQGAEAKLVS